MPRYLKGKKIVNKGANLHREFQDQSKVYNSNGKPTHISLLADRFKESELHSLRQKNINIKDYRFAISPNFTIYNLSKLGFETQFNFVFTEEDLQNMLSAPKTLIAENSFAVKDMYDDEYAIHRFYLIAPSLVSTELPVLYRMSVQISKSNTYSISLQAIVGGCRDGAVNLLRIDSPHKVIGENEDYYIDKPHIHKAQAYKANKKFEHMPKTMIDDGVDSVEDALKLFFNLSGVKYKVTSLNEPKLFKIIDILNKDKAHTVANEIDITKFVDKIADTNIENLELREFVRKKSNREVTLADVELI